MLFAVPMSDFSVILNNQQQPIPLYKGNRLYSFYAPEKEVARYIDLKYTNKKYEKRPRKQANDIFSDISPTKIMKVE